MKVFVVDPKNNEYGAREIEPTLESYYEVIGCSVIDIVPRTVAGKWFDVICDDEALLKADPMVSALNGRKEPMLCGTLIFCHHDGEGRELGLDDVDVRHLENHVVPISTTTHPEYYCAMRSCEYFA